MWRNAGEETWHVQQGDLKAPTAAWQPSLHQQIARSQRYGMVSAFWTALHCRNAQWLAEIELYILGRSGHKHSKQSGTGDSIKQFNDKEK